MTTRIRGRALALQFAVTAAMLFSGGCATPGPLHVYSLKRSDASDIHDHAGEVRVKTPSFVTADERVVGFAYDPFTDHFFVRLAPGDRIRVIDRPARAVKREFRIEHPAAVGGSDLTIRPRDGHVFLSSSNESEVIETTRLGKVVRVISLESSPDKLRGLAYDGARDQLCALHGDPHKSLTWFDLSGRAARSIRLGRALAGPLAFDAERREFYTPVGNPNGPASKVEVFDENGAWLRSLPAPADYVDVGPRSLVRIF